MKDAEVVEVLDDLLRQEQRVTVPASGVSMGRAFRHADALTICVLESARLGLGEVVVYKRFDRWIAHRVIARKTLSGQRKVLTKGDGSWSADYPAVDVSDIVGTVTAIHRHGNIRRLTTPAARLGGRLKALVGLCMAAGWHVLCRRRLSSPM